MHRIRVERFMISAARMWPRFVRGYNSADISGLLSGLGDFTVTNWTSYSKMMPIQKAHQLAMAECSLIPGICFKLFGKEKAGINKELSTIFGNANTFLSSKELCDRGKMYESLKRIVELKGLFACVLGGRNTGKTFVLKKLSTDFPGKVLLVNMRHHRDIASGLLRVVLENKRSWDELFPKIAVDNLLQSGFFVGEVGDGLHSNDIASVLARLKTIPSGEALRKLIVLLSLEKNFAVTIVIDEANLALTVEDKALEARRALALFTSITKAEKLVNVVLVSSEHEFPSKLQRQDLCFNTENLSRIIYAGEVSPTPMFHLLTSGWGVPPELAHALMSYCGGNIYNTFLALENLLDWSRSEDEADYFVFNSDLTYHVRRCLKWEKSEEMKEALTSLATYGFYGIARDDPRVEIIRDNDVGGLVTWRATIIGLDCSLWSTTIHEDALLPTCQSMRIAIAQVLANERA